MANDARELTCGQVSEMMLTLGKAGLTKEIAIKIQESEALARELMEYVAKRKNWVTRKKAEEICKNRFIGLDDATLWLGIEIDDDTKDNFELVPFTEDELISARNYGYILVFMPFRKLSIGRLKRWITWSSQAAVDYCLGDSNNPDRFARRGYFLTRPALEHSGRRTYEQSMEEMWSRKTNVISPFTCLSAVELAYIELVFFRKYSRSMPSQSGLFNVNDILRCSDQVTKGRHLAIELRTNDPVPLDIFEVNDSKNDGFDLQLAAGHYFEMK